MSNIPVNLGHAIVQQSTDKALLVKLDAEDEPRWVPKSCIHDNSEVFEEKSEPGDLIVLEWWADKEGLV